MYKISKICWIVASALILINGLLHLQGIFYTDDLNPAHAELIPPMQSTCIKMEPSANFWNLWIGFNALFSVGLIFFGLTILYLSAKHFFLLCSMHFILLLTIISNAYIVWLGYQYLITAFVISLAVPLLLFVIGYTVVLIGYKELKLSLIPMTDVMIHKYEYSMSTLEAIIRFGNYQINYSSVLHLHLKQSFDLIV